MCGAQAHADTPEFGLGLRRRGAFLFPRAQAHCGHHPLRHLCAGGGADALPGGYSTRVLISLWDSLMFGRVPDGYPFVLLTPFQVYFSTDNVRYDETSHPGLELTAGGL